MFHIRSRRTCRASLLQIIGVVTACAALVCGAAISLPQTAGAASRASLSPGQELTTGQELNDGPFTLVMQPDGNLVEYVSEPNGQSYPLWATNTFGNPGATAVMQPDGNFVIYLNGRPLWATGTYGHPGAGFIVWFNGTMFMADSTGLLWGVGQGPASGGFPQPLPSGTAVLDPGEGLFNGQYVVAGQYLLSMQTDGNLVVYGPGWNPLWASGTVGEPGDWLVMQSDGNLVIYDAHGNPIWATGTYGNPGAAAVMQSDSNFVVYSSSGQPLWASNSQSGYANPLRSVQSLVPERIDQGVDYSGNGPVYAIGNGVVLSLDGSGWPGTGVVTYQLTAGPAAGLDVYFAECIQPTVQVGQQVNSGTQIGVMSTACGTGIETGWSAGDDLIPDAAAYWCFDGADPTTYGQNFSDFLVSTGAPGGILDGPLTCPSPPPVPSYPGAPAAFPTWGASNSASIGSAQPSIAAPSTQPAPQAVAGGNVAMPQLHGGQTLIPQAAYSLLQQVGQAVVTDQWASVPLVPGGVTPESSGLKGHSVGSIEVVSTDNAQQPTQVVAVINIPGTAVNGIEVTIQLQPFGTWALANVET